MLVWAGLVTTPAVGTVDTFAPFTLDRPEAFPVRRPACKTPDTVRELRVPTDVILVWAGLVTTPAVGTVETFAPFTLDRPEAFPTNKPACETPETVREVKVPTDVMLGWAG